MILSSGSHEAGPSRRGPRNMRMMLVIFCGLGLGLFGCHRGKYRSNPVVKKLNDSAVHLMVAGKDDSSRKAVMLLQQAEDIDSNYFYTYYNKYIVLWQLREYRSALAAVENLIRLNPANPDFYSMKAALCDRVGDSVSARLSYTKSLKLYDQILDTMNFSNSAYDNLVMKKALAFVMLGDQSRGNQLLQEVYDRQVDSPSRQFTRSFMNKNKQQLLQFGDSSSVRSRAVIAR